MLENRKDQRVKDGGRRDSRQSTPHPWNMLHHSQLNGSYSVGGPETDGGNETPNTSEIRKVIIPPLTVV